MTISVLDIFILLMIVAVYASTIIVTGDFLFNLKIIDGLDYPYRPTWKLYIGYMLVFGWLLGFSLFVGNAIYDALFFLPEFYEPDELGEMVSGKKAASHMIGFLISFLLMDKMSKSSTESKKS